MKTDLFDFDLPPERIALRPVHPRDAARLLVVRPGGKDKPQTPFAPAQAGAQSLTRDGAEDSWVPAFAGTNGDTFEDRSILDLPDLLQPGDCLVVNDSKVIAARLKGRRIGRGSNEPAIEATLHKRIDGSTWKAFILGAKKVQVGDTLRFGDGDGAYVGRTAVPRLRRVVVGQD